MLNLIIVLAVEVTFNELYSPSVGIFVMMMNDMDSGCQTARCLVIYQIISPFSLVKCSCSPFKSTFSHFPLLYIRVRLNSSDQTGPPNFYRGDESGAAETQDGVDVMVISWMKV